MVVMILGIRLSPEYKVFLREEPARTLDCVGVVGDDGELPGDPTTDADWERERCCSRELADEWATESEEDETRSRGASREELGEATLTSFWKKLGAMHAAGCPWLMLSI